MKQSSRELRNCFFSIFYFLFSSRIHCATVNALTKECNLQCDNGGICSFQPLHPNPTNSLHAQPQQQQHDEVLPTDGSLGEFCLCPPSYTGLTCSEPTSPLNECYHYGGNHRCRGGGFCRPLSTSTYDLETMKENVWKCDCLVADRVSRFAGAMCREPSTEYCDAEGDVFCTNGGTCVNNLIEYDVHHHSYHNQRYVRSNEIRLQNFTFMFVPSMRYHVSCFYLFF